MNLRNHRTIILRIHLMTFHFLTFRGWSSQQKKFFKKTFDSRTSFAASSQLTHFYNRDIRNGSVLSIYRDLKSNRIHFDINGEEGWVNFSQNEPDFWYGYIRLSSTGSGSKIQVTLVPEKDQGKGHVIMHLWNISDFLSLLVSVLVSTSVFEQLTLTVGYIVLMMLDRRIWYWIN